MQAIVLSCLVFISVIILLKCSWSSQNLDLPNTTLSPRETWLNIIPNTIQDTESDKRKLRTSKLLTVLKGYPLKDKYLSNPKSNPDDTNEDYTTTELAPDLIGPRLSATLLKILA